MGIEVRIRRATSSDLPVLASFVEQLSYPTDRERLAQILDLLLHDDRHLVLVGEDPLHGIVGLLSLSSRPVLRLQGWIGTVEELAVASSWRGCGIGGRLLQHAKGVATERGWVRLEAGVARGREAIRRQFFLSRGFVEAESLTYRWAPLEGRNPPLPVLGARSKFPEFV